MAGEAWNNFSRARKIKVYGEIGFIYVMVSNIYTLSSEKSIPDILGRLQAIPAASDSGRLEAWPNF